MSFQSKLEHKAKVTKWKVDRQIRISKLKNTLRDQENLLEGAFFELGQNVFAAFELNDLEETTKIKKMCLRIEKINKEIYDIEGRIDSIKSEEPPEIQESEMKLDSSATVGPILELKKTKKVHDQIICKQCGANIPVRFCPNCGEDHIVSEGKKNDT